jgi:3-dehydroquinate dehydratase/shikimate dehydrogenase
MSSAAKHCDLLEIRLDFIDKPDLPRLLAGPPKPVIVTNRPEREMGRFRGSEAGRIRLLQEAERFGADYIDIELDSAAQFKRLGKAELIVSYHNFESTPPDLDSIHARLVAAGADIAKIATFAQDITDNVVLFEFLGRVKSPTIGVCMGECGQISRILAPKFGSFLTFAAMEAGRESAPGQIEAETLLKRYRFRKIHPGTGVYGVIANPVSHSMSPHIHNAAFEERGIDAVYVPFLVSDVTEFLAAFRRIGVSGYSITIPHKEASVRSLDHVDGLAARIGAVNTIVNRDGRLYGYNTDLMAATTAIEDKLKKLGDESPQPLRGKRVVIVGAGGAGRGIAFGVKERGGLVTVANRTKSRAVRVAEEVGCRGISLRTLLKEGIDADVLINASSVGMHPKVDEAPVPREMLRPSMMVFDAVYNPIETRLLREARELGCPTVSGFEMFVRQAVAQFELWTGQPAPRDLMASVVRQRLEGTHA